MSRNYRKEYDNYHSRPEQKIRRAARNAARRLFADAAPDKDVHHKDNNPLNNDKKNLSLVTQYYNRREPRLRDEAFPSGTGSTVLVHNNKVIAKGSKSAMLKQMKQIRKKTGDSHKKLFLGNSPSRKIGDVWKEDMGTTTGPHIAGTGDDSSTVIVKKKKKVYRRKTLKKRIIDNVLTLNKR